MSSADSEAYCSRVRSPAGDVFGWDDERSRLPIPGCEERSLVERLPAELAAEAPPFDPRRDFQLVYATAGERLYEISNATVHALMHLSWVPSDGSRRVAHMAVYCKPRGLLGKLYMAAITPFRLFIVYPALLRSLGRRWRAATAAAVAAA